MELEQLFLSSFTDESLQATFYSELLHQPLYVLAQGEHFDGVLEEGNAVEFVVLRHEDTSYVPIFLSKESMELFLEGKQVASLKLKGADLFETLQHRNVIINAGQDKNIVLYANEIKQILAQRKH